MRKLTLSGEYCFDNEEWINWWGDVELDDKQVSNLIKLIKFNSGIPMLNIQV